MFDVSPMELLVMGAVAIVVIPPKDLPKAMRFAGQWIGKARSVARQFRSGFDEIVREAELHEMEKKWREENDRIMRDHPPAAYLEGPETVEHEPAQPLMVEKPAVAPAPSDEPAAPTDKAAS